VINTFVIFLSRILASIIDSFLRSDEEESAGTSWTYFIISFVLEIVFSILASIVVMWFSRHREYRADEGSARFV
jgi:heat shock protein HtpX